MICRNLRLLAFLFVYGTCVTSVRGQLSSSEIDSLVTKALKQMDVAGAAVGIVKDGKVIHQRGYGVRSIKSEGAVDAHTLFAIASNSKAFTTAGLAILVDEGKIHWHDKVKKYIPKFKMYNAYVTENFTIEDLLTHRSGLGLGVGDLMFFPDGADFTIDDVVQCFQHFKPQSAFRTKYDYDNLLYFVAGEVVARVSGQTWEEFTESRIFKPLGMTRSAATLNRIKDMANVATPHSTETSKIRTIPHFEGCGENVNGAPGGIFSSVSDICKWMNLHLNRGKYGEKLDKTLFSSQRQREMWQIHTTIPQRPNFRYKSHFNGYGLGWGLKDVNGNLSVSHTGGLPGMLSKTLMIPDLKLGIVVLTNTSNGGGGLFHSVVQSILDSYLGLDDFGWIEKMSAQMKRRAAMGDQVSAKVWQIVEEAKNTKVDATKYVGVYTDPWFGKVEVFKNGDQLWIKCHRSPKLNGPMHFYKANAFAIKWEYQDMPADAFAVFSLDEEGRAQTFKMKGISPNIDFSFDFHDLHLTRTNSP